MKEENLMNKRVSEQTKKMNEEMKVGRKEGMKKAKEAKERMGKKKVGQTNQRTNDHFTKTIKVHPNAKTTLQENLT